MSMPPNRGNKSQKRRVVCSSSVVRDIIMHGDYHDMVFSKLSPRHLILCSMVCKTFLHAIDKTDGTFFYDCLPWWLRNFSYARAPVLENRQEQKMVPYRQDKQIYEDQFVIENSEHQSLWAFNMISTKGAKVKMRMTLRINLDFVKLTGEDKYVNMVKTQGFAHIDTLDWEVRSVTKQNHLSERSTVCRGDNMRVRMKLLKFMGNDKRVQLEIMRPVMIDFDNVPVLDKPLSYRNLCVMKCMQKCMHCIERTAKWMSVDVDEPHHRILCSTCFDQLYIIEASMKSKWKCTRQINNDTTQSAVPRNVFFLCYKGAPSRLLPGKPLVCMQKEKVAQSLGHSDWTMFLQENRTHKRRQRGFSDPFNNFLWGNIPGRLWS